MMLIAKCIQEFGEQITVNGEELKPGCSDVRFMPRKLQTNLQVRWVMLTWLKIKS